MSISSNYEYRQYERFFWNEVHILTVLIAMMVWICSSLLILYIIDFQGALKTTKWLSQLINQTVAVLIRNVGANFFTRRMLFLSPNQCQSMEFSLMICLLKYLVDIAFVVRLCHCVFIPACYALLQWWAILQISSRINIMNKYYDNQ